MVPKPTMYIYVKRLPHITIPQLPNSPLMGHLVPSFMYHLPEIF